MTQLPPRSLKAAVNGLLQHGPRVRGTTYFGLLRGILTYSKVTRRALSEAVPQFAKFA
jgi:hypothetical protein